VEFIKDNIASTEGTNNLFSSPGTVINSADFTVIAFGVVSTSTLAAFFISVAEKAQGSNGIIIRLFDVDDALELASLTFDTSTDPVRKQVGFNLPGGNHIVEVQGKRISGSGNVFMAEIR